jgi:SulP family sulfate permease
MAEKQEFLRLVKERQTGIVLVPTFALTLVENLTVGIVAGCVFAVISSWFTSAQTPEGA